VSILATLRQDRTGEWKNLDDYLRELRRRETGALAALAGVLTAPAQEQKELAGHGEAGAVLLEVASDLRVPKGARLAAARCLLEAGIGPPAVGHLFTGAGDLATDPRLGAVGRKLVEAGLSAALQLGGESSQITLAAGAFARAVHAGASAVGQARIRELLSGAPELHAGAIAGRFALGIEELPEGHRAGWKRLLQETCAAWRRAPAAARRVGLAPAWPPNLPEAFAAMIREAEQQAPAGEAPDAARDPAASKKPAAGKPEEKAKGAPPKVAAGKTLAPAIRRSPFRRAIGSVMEVPASPRPMEAVAARPAASEPPPGPAAHGPLPLAPLPSREKKEEPTFDSRGRQVPRADRWSEEQFEWAEPSLPSPELPPPPRVRRAQGPFAQRVQSIFEDRPEAVERLCAAAEARAASAGEEPMLREISAELSREVWRERTLPPEQAQRLRAVAGDAAQPGPWRSAARRLLDFFVSGRA